MPRDKKRDELTPEQEVARTIDSAGHSENLVRKLVEEGNHNDEIHDTIDRNVRHLEIVLGREGVANSGSDRLQDFRDAIELGQAFIAET